MTSLFNRSNQNQVKKADSFSGSFTTCVLKVDGTGWEKTIIKVLSNMHGVYNFKMIGNGKIIVSGKVEPTKLLKFIAKAGKTAEVLWWQFGECSTNLFLPINQHYSIMNSSQYGYGSIGSVYGGGGGFYDNGYGGNNYYQGGYGGSSRLDDIPCPSPLKQKSEQEDPMKCCTIM